MVDGSTPKISQDVMPKYREFVQMMQIVFTPEGMKEPTDKLEKIVSKPITSCEDASLKDKQIILKNQTAVREVKKRVAEPLEYSTRAYCEGYEVYSGDVPIQQRRTYCWTSAGLQKGGIPAVNRLADEARTFLAEYYKQCEGTYRLGALAAISSSWKRHCSTPEVKLIFFMLYLTFKKWKLHIHQDIRGTQGPNNLIKKNIMCAN
jgi:hypothetical protein